MAVLQTLSSSVAFVFWMLFILAGVIILVFSISMLVDCLRRNFKNENEKIIWAVVIAFIHIIGALAYYFLIKIFFLMGYQRKIIKIVEEKIKENKVKLE